MNIVSTDLRPFAASPHARRGSFGPPAAPSDLGPRPVSSRPATSVAELSRPHPASHVADLVRDRPASEVASLRAIFRRFADGLRTTVSDAPRPDAEPSAPESDVAPDPAGTFGAPPAPDVTRADTQVAPDLEVSEPGTRERTQVAPDRTVSKPRVTRADTQLGPDRKVSEPRVTRADPQVAPDREISRPGVTREDTQVAPDRLVSEPAPEVTRADTQVAPDATVRTMGDRATFGAPSVEPRLFDRLA